MFGILSRGVCQRSIAYQHLMTLESLSELHLSLQRSLCAPNGTVQDASYREDTSNNGTDSGQKRGEGLALLFLNHQHG